MNSGTDDDSETRRRAIDATRSVVLQAPAGSGKTTVLTQRLLALLATVDEPEEILAVTFTRKAAAQIRARILAALAGDWGQGEAGERMRTLAGAALARSEARDWGLGVNASRLRIQTLDSFNYWLASQLPVTAKASTDLIVADRPEEIFRRAARSTLIAGEADAELAPDLQRLFERLDNHWANVERLLSQMLAQRGHWLPHVLAHEPGALGARIAASLGHVVADHLALACEALSASQRAQAQNLPGVGVLGAGPEHLQAWQRLAAQVLTDKGRGGWRRSVTRIVGPGYEEKQAREALKSCIEQLAGAPGAGEALGRIALLPNATLDVRDVAALESLSRVLKAAAAQLQAEFAAAARVDHTYIAGAARAALADSGQPTDLALRAGLALRHILVDEFQDTSLAQFQLLESLTAGWDEGDGRTLFVVGDPMQSIYQFREAEVGLFLRARDHGIGSVRLEALELQRNFRSRPELIAWVNTTFTALFPARDDLRASAVAFAPSVATRAPADDPGVHLRLFAAGDRRAEAAAVAARAATLTRADPAASVAVLVSSRAHAAAITAALGAAGVAAVGVDLTPLGEVPIVSDLAALLRALHHLGDRTAWLSILRAPWCGVSLTTLSALSQRRDAQLVWEAMAQEERLAGVAAPDRQRIERVRSVLGAALEARDRVPLAEWLERTWIQLGGADAYSQSELAHSRAFFAALASRAASGEWRGPEDSGALSRDLYAQPQADAAQTVQVMTIHRAKGLEFDHVIIPSLDRALNRGSEPLMRWLDLPRAFEDSDLLIAPTPVIGAEDGGSLNAYVKHLSELRAAHEQVRLLYVATTRARETLYLSAAPPLRTGTIAPRAGTLLARLWPALAQNFAPPDSSAGAAALAAVRDTRLRRLPSDWRLAELEPAAARPRLPLDHQSLSAPEFSWVGETGRHIGTVVHAGLQRFAGLNLLPAPDEIESARPNYRDQLRRHGVAERELDAAADDVVTALVRSVTDQRGRWILSTQHRDAASELALTGIAGGTLQSVVIDRSFIDLEGVRWVIDFKTSRHEGGDLAAFVDQQLERYRPQLTRYVELARALGPEPVRAALYLPLQTRFSVLE